MALTRLSDDLDVIIKLDDEPNDVGGFSADELKAKFDEAGNLIKEYLNSVLLVELEQDGASSIGVQNVEGMVATTLKGAFEEILQSMEDITQGSVADGSITTEKLASSAVTTEKIDNGAVTTAKIADNVLTSAKIAGSAVTTAKINNKAVTTDKINDYAVTAVKLGTGSVVEAKLANSAVTNSKIANSAVTNGKIADAAVGTAKLANGAATSEKIAVGAVSGVVNFSIPSDQTWTLNGAGTYECDVTVSGIAATDDVILTLRRGQKDGMPTAAWNISQPYFDSDNEKLSKILACHVSAANTLHFIASENGLGGVLYLAALVIKR